MPKSFIERCIRKDYDNASSLIEAINLSGAKFGVSELISLRRGETVKVPMSEYFKDIYYSAAGSRKVHMLNDEVTVGSGRLDSRYVAIAAAVASSMEGLSRIVGIDGIISVGAPQITVTPRIDGHQYYLVGEMESRDERCTTGASYPIAFSTKSGITVSGDLIKLGHSWMHSGIAHELVHFYRQNKSNVPDAMMVEVNVGGERDIYGNGSINIIFEEITAEFIGNSIALKGRFSGKHSIAIHNLMRLSRYLAGFEHEGLGEVITPTDVGHFLGTYLYAVAILDRGAYATNLAKGKHSLPFTEAADTCELIDLLTDGKLDRDISISKELIGEVASLETLDRLCIITTSMKFESLIESFGINSIGSLH